MFKTFRDLSLTLLTLARKEEKHYTAFEWRTWGCWMRTCASFFPQLSNGLTSWFTLPCSKASCLNNFCRRECVCKTPQSLWNPPQHQLCLQTWRVLCLIQRRVPQLCTLKTVHVLCKWVVHLYQKLDLFIKWLYAIQLGLHLVLEASPAHQMIMFLHLYSTPRHELSLYAFNMHNTMHSSSYDF